MKIENLTFRERMWLLKTIHSKLNKMFFDGLLHDVDMEICNMQNEDICGGFRRGSNKQKSTIGIDASYYFDFLCKLDTEEAIERLLETILHEMIHQYCFENNIYAKYHCREFASVAVEHGLQLECFDDEDDYIEYLLFDSDSLIKEIIEEMEVIR